MLMNHYATELLYGGHKASLDQARDLMAVPSKQWHLQS